MPPTPPPSPAAGRGLERAVQVGIDLVRSARAAARTQSGPVSRERRMAAERQQALVRHELEVRRHDGRIAALRSGTVAGGVGAAGFGVAALAAVAGTAAAPAVIVLGGLAAGSAAMGLRMRQRATVLVAHPPVAQLPPPPPARLRPGARGADQADRVANALIHLYDLVPSVGRLYPAAGQELWRALSDVEPLLRGQVERLASLDRVEWEMPGSRAAQAAVEAGTEIRGRLLAGADALEELVAAAVRMLAAPDLGDGVPDALAPAIDGLEAFAHGLHVANAARTSGR